MYIVEMNDKNLMDAAECYYNSWLSSHAYHVPEDTLSVYSVERVANVLKKDNTMDRITFIAYDKNTVNGLVTIDKERSEIAHLYIVPEKQRQGLGTKLLEFGIKQMTSISRVYTTVLAANNVGVDFFEKYGFEFTGEQRTLKNGMLELKYVFRKKK
jgi:ribosomal protein S18 acetylase RimI-like enzyme